MMEKKNEKMGVWQGMKNCYYLLTTPKFVLLTFTMFANGKLIGIRVEENRLLFLFISI